MGYPLGSNPNLIPGPGDLADSPGDNDRCDCGQDFDEYGNCPECAEPDEPEEGLWTAAMLRRATPPPDPWVAYLEELR